MTPRKLALLSGLALILPAMAWCAPKAHLVALGAVRREPYSAQGDPAGARKEETELRCVRWWWMAR
jgi:hypothetical protein